MAKQKIQNLKEDMVLVLINGLKEGYTIRQVRNQLKERGIKPNSEESVDLYLREIRRRNNCKTLFELMYLLGKGLILKINE